MTETATSPRKDMRSWIAELDAVRELIQIGRAHV